MKQVLKFRVWDKQPHFMKDDGSKPDGPHMKYDVGVTTAKSWFTGQDGIHIPPNHPDFELMQFIGLLDHTEEKEIYDQDYLWDYKGNIWLVKFEQQVAGFYLSNVQTNRKYDFLSCAMLGDGEKYILTGMRVIGNVFESVLSDLQLKYCTQETNQ